MLNLEYWTVLLKWKYLVWLIEIYSVKFINKIQNCFISFENDGSCAYEVSIEQ